MGSSRLAVILLNCPRRIKIATIQQTTAHEKVTARALGDAKGTLSLKNLTGKWNNCDRNTRGLVRLVLGTKGSSLTVQGFGSCTPTPCDWGVVEGTAYGDSVVATEAIAFSARYDFSFKETIVTGHVDNGTLIVETFDKFKDSCVVPITIVGVSLPIVGQLTS